MPAAIRDFFVPAAEFAVASDLHMKSGLISASVSVEHSEDSIIVSISQKMTVMFLEEIDLATIVVTVAPDDLITVFNGEIEVHLVSTKTRGNFFQLIWGAPVKSYHQLRKPGGTITFARLNTEPASPFFSTEN